MYYDPDEVVEDDLPSDEMLKAGERISETISYPARPIELELDEVSQPSTQLVPNPTSPVTPCADALA